MRKEKAPVKVSVDGRVFGSLTIAAGFMNISCSCLSIQLQNGVTSYQGFTIGYALENIPKEEMCLGCWTYPVDGRCGCKFGGKNVDTKRS